MFILSFLIRWLIPFAILFLLESNYISYTSKIWVVVITLTILITWMWMTTKPVGQGDDDSSGNSNVGRKFTDIM